eukprot:217001_1
MKIIQLYDLTLLVFYFASTYTTQIPVADYLYYDEFRDQPYTVTYDSRSFIINGTRTLLIGGSMHYERIPYYQWKDMLLNMKNDGLNHVQTYIFWNIHEPTYNFNGTHIYNYKGRANITQYLEIAKEVGMFVNMRVGPFSAGEWHFGGVPLYLLHIPGLYFRTYDQQWLHYVKLWLEEVSTKLRPYLAINGGPIILAQIENEYHGQGVNGTKYVQWCGDLAASLNFSIPWGMCNGETANNTVETCNGGDCYATYLPTHSAKHPDQPLAWTEDEGGFEQWSQYDNNRTTADMANTLTKWFGGGASHSNYYMYCGGNHLNNYAAAGITNYYANNVNYFADGLPNEPKRSHLAQLHHIVADKQKILLYDNIQYGNEIYLNTTTSTNINYHLFAYVYKGENNEKVSFLYNNDTNHSYTVLWNDKQYYLPESSVSVVDNNQMEMYNSAKINMSGIPSKRVYNILVSNMNFSSWSESIPITDKMRNDMQMKTETPLEQLRFTNDTYQHLIYNTSIENLPTGKDLLLKWRGYEGSTFQVFLDNYYIGQDWQGGNKFSIKEFGFSVTIPSKYITNSKHVLTIESTSLGMLAHCGPETDESKMDKKGIFQPIQLYNGKALIKNLTDNGWSHWIGLTGELLNVFSYSGMNNVDWKYPVNTQYALTWYKTEFTISNDILNDNSSVVLLDIGNYLLNVNDRGLNRGHFYLNGNNMGNYNNAVVDNTMVQQYYFLPKDFIKTNEKNLLVFFEELPSVDLANVNIVCSTVVIP